MPYYETIPTVIEAIQFTKDNIEDVLNFTNGKASIKVDDESIQVVIDTLEGKMLAPEGSYIIRGVLNEYYPCTKDAFNKKYKLMEGEINHGEV